MLIILWKKKSLLYSNNIVITFEKKKYVNFDIPYILLKRADALFSKLVYLNEEKNVV